MIINRYVSKIILAAGIFSLAVLFVAAETQATSNCGTLPPCQASDYCKLVGPGTYDCDGADPGYYAPGDNAQYPCGANNKWDGGDHASCNTVTSGYYTTGGTTTTRTGQTQCQIGYWCNTNGEKVTCANAPSNAHYTTAGWINTACPWTCNTGYYQNTSGTCSLSGMCGTALAASYYSFPPDSALCTGSTTATNKTSSIAGGDGYFRWDCPVQSTCWSQIICAAGQYWTGTACANVGVLYYSPVNDYKIYACKPYRKTVGYGAGADNIADCLAIKDYYGTNHSVAATTVSTGQYSPERDDNPYTCTNKPANSHYTGTGDGGNNCPWACDGGYYLVGGTSCNAVGAGYWAASGDNVRTACKTNRFTTGSSTGADDIADCLAGEDYYGTDHTIAGIAVGTGKYSPYRDDTRYDCSNKPTNSTYTGDGGGANNCAWSCNSNYTNVNGTCVFSNCGTGQYFDGADCTDVGAGYWSPDNDGSRYACPSNRYTSGVAGTDADSQTDCLAGRGYYGDNTATAATAAGDSYYSPYRDNQRYACAANSYTAAGTEADEVSDCKCGTDYYPVSSVCTAVGAGYYAEDRSNVRTACTNTKPTHASYSGDGNGANNCAWACDGGYYLNGSVCSSVGTGYWSPAGSNTRTACKANRFTEGTGSGADDISDCLAGADFYGTDHTVDAVYVGAGYWSPIGDDTRYECTGKPTDHATYSGSGGGEDNCAWACDLGYIDVNGVCLFNNCGGGSYFNGAECADVGAGYWSPANDPNRYACPTNRYTTGVAGLGADSQTDCLAGAGYYGDSTSTAATAVGASYYSPYRDNLRYQCSANSYTGENTEADEASDCKCGVDYYLVNSACVVVGTGYYSPDRDNTRTICSNVKPENSAYTGDGNGTNNCPWACDGGYWLYNGNCTEVGTGYWSPAGTNTRTACQSYRATAGSGAGADDIADCLAITDYYGTNHNGAAIPVSAGKYSPNRDDSAYDCTNKLDKSYYTGVGNGTNNCPWACNGGYYKQESNCTAVGTCCWAAAGSTSPIACKAHRATSGSDSDADDISDCLADVDYYGTNHSLDAIFVDVGHYSPTRNDNIYDCSNKPENAYYTSSGGGINNCAWECDARYTKINNSCSLSSCAAGKYFDGTVCKDVGLGYWSPADDGNRYQCTAGYYGAGNSASVGTCDGQCDAGYYCSAGSTSKTQNACGINKYCPVGSSAPQDCPLHSSNPNSTSSSIDACLGDAGWHNCQSGTCSQSTAGYFSLALNNTQTICGTGRSSGTGSSACIAWEHPMPTDIGSVSSNPIEFTGTPTNLGAGIANCFGQVDRDKVSPWDFEGEIGSDGDYTFSSGQNGSTYYYRFYCADSAGNTSNWANWSDGIIIDTLPPQVLNRETQDLDKDGQLDALKLTFDQPIRDTSVTGNIKLTNENNTPLSGTALTVLSDVANDETLYISFTESASNDTNQTIKSKINGIADMPGNLVPADAGFVAATDKAGPAVTQIAILDREANGDADTAKIVLSENIIDATFNSVQWTVSGATVENTLRTGQIDNVGTIIDAANDNTIYLGFTPDTLYLKNTATNNELFDITAQSISLYDIGGNAIPNLATDDIVESDAMRPVVEKAEALDSNQDGSMDQVQLTFTEPINDTNISTDHVHFGLPIADASIMNMDLATGATSNDDIILLTNFIPVDEGNTSLEEHSYNVSISSSTLTDMSANANPIADLAENGLITEDKANPAILTAETSDLDVNGKIDTITLSLSEKVDIGVYSGSGITINGYTITSTVVEDIDQTKVKLSLQEKNSFDTGATPTLTIDSEQIEFQDSSSNKLAAYSNAIADRTPPVISNVFYNPELDRYDVFFSETIKTDTLDNPVNDWQFSDTNANFDENSMYSISGNPDIQINPGSSATVPMLSGTEYIAPKFNEIADAEGNFITSAFNNNIKGLLIYDGAAPYLLTAETGDVNSDGYIDRIVLTYSENITGSDSSSGFTVTEVSGNDLSVDSITVDNSSTVVLNLENSKTSIPDTGDMPTLVYTRGNNAIKDSDDREANNQQFTSTQDKIAPVVVRAEAFKTSVSAPDLLYLEFSEPLLNNGNYTLWSNQNQPTVQSSTLFNSNRQVSLTLGNDVLVSAFSGTAAISDQNNNTAAAAYINPANIDKNVLIASADEDNDGVTNLESYYNYTLPVIEGETLLPDSDEDGVRDDYEITYFNSLSTINSTLADTDSDTLPDLWEMIYFNSLNQNNSSDSDNDTIRNIIEYRNGTNPNSANNGEDADSDSMPNRFEYSNNLNPSSAADNYLDPDNDSLTNLEEYRNGTDPNNASNGTDTDGDLMPDFWERAYDLNDANGDEDSDTLPNVIEFRNGTNPRLDSNILADSDSDHLPDMWETANFGSLSQTANGDLDSDSLTNLEEYRNGTDPNNASNGTDTDGDLMPDFWERAYDLSPNIASDGQLDDDSDNIESAEEYLNGTNPIAVDIDTDNDGMADIWEFANFDNLNQVATGDPDSDGLPSLLEYANGTNPNATDIDTDLDGMPDIWEKAHGLNFELNSDAWIDLDYDGLNNAIEFKTGGDPNVHKKNEVDSDSDHMPDRWELVWFGNLIQQPDADYDSDAMPNMLEYRNGTNPKIAQTDSDSDLMDNAWETSQNVSDAKLDPDNDGLTNAEEYLNGTNPNVNDRNNQVQIDTDLDGIPDDWELAWFGNLDQTYVDSDLDGLTNSQEFYDGTNPNVKNNTLTDSDLDGLPDVYEKANFGNLNQDQTTDIDSDSALDLIEYQAGTDPKSALQDSDNDEMSDAWEISYGLNPYYASDTNNDPDNDSRTNLEEYQDNTNPRIPEYGSDSTCASNASPLNITEPKIFYNDDKIILTWADSSDSDVTHVQIFRSVGAGAPAYQNPINVLHGTQRYEDEGIIKDEIYAYSFQTLDSCGKNSSIWENAVRITTNDDQIAPPPEDGSITITLKLATTKENEKRFVDKIKGIFEKMAQGVSQVTRDILASAADMFNPNEQSESEQGEPAEPISTSTGSAITENAAGSGSQVNTDNTDIGTGTGEQAAQPQGKLSSIVQKQLQAKRDEVAINATENIALVYLTNDEYTRALETAEIAEKGSSAQMSAELVKARQDLVAKTSEQDRLESDIQYFTNLINTTQQEIEVLQLQEANAAGENTYEREILQSKKEEVDSQITLAMNEKATTEDTINNMTTEKNDLQNQRQSIDAEIVNTKAQKQEIENGSGDEPLIDKIAQLERNIARAISEINYKQSDINGINSSIEKLSKGDMSPEAISQIMQTMDGQRLEITAYKNQKIEKDAQKKQLEVSLAAANVQLQDLSEKYFMATNAKNKIAQDIANYGQTINYKDQAQLLDAINQKLIEAVDSSKTATDNDLVNLSKVQEAGDLKQVLEKYNDAIIAASDKEILTLKEKVEYALKNKYQFSALQPYMTWEESVASCGQTGFRLPTSDEIKWAVNNDAIQLPKEDWQSYAYHRLWTSDIISKPPTGNMNPDLPAISWRGAAAIYSGDLSLFGLKSKGIVWAFPATEQTCTVTYTGFFREKTIECEPNQYETACLYEGNIGDLKIKEWQEYNAKIIKLSEIVIQEIENNNLKPENFPALLQRLDVLKNIIAYTSDNSNYNLQGLRDKIADFEQNPPYQSAKVGFLELTEERDQAIQNENLVSYYVEQAKNKNAVEKSLAQNLSHLRKIYDNNAEVIALFSNTGSSVVLSQMQETNDELTEKYDISNINADSSLAFPDELRKEFVADSINKIIEYTNLQNAADDKEREAQEAGNKMKEAETVSQLVKTNLTQAVNSISEIDRQIILLEGSLLTNQYKLEISQVGIIRLDKLTQELNKIEQEYQDLIVRKSDMETELTDLKDELISTNSALGEVIGKLDSLEKQKQQIINSISEQTIAITAQKELLKNVSRRLKEFDQRKKDVDEQLLALDRGENIRTRIQNKETAIYEYQINIARTQSGITALNDVIANLENSIENNLRNQEQYQIGIVEKAVMDKISQFVDMHIAEDLLRQNLSAIASQLNGTDLSTTNEILAQTDLVKALDNIANIKEILRGHSIQGTADFYRSGSVDIVRSADVATNIYGIATVALPGLQPGKYDIVIHASRITPRRIKDIDIQFGENTIDATNEYLSFGDLNGDEKINRDDLDYAIHHWDAAGADLNEDGEINLRDLLYIYKNWGAE